MYRRVSSSILVNWIKSSPASRSCNVVTHLRSIQSGSTFSIVKYFSHTNSLSKPVFGGLNRLIFDGQPKRFVQTIPSLNEDDPVVGSNDRTKSFHEDHQIFVRGAQVDPVFDFANLAIPDQLKQILGKLNYVETTPIQAQSLPILFNGQDLIGIAQTGSGKTLAYLLPAFEKFFSIHREYFSNTESGQFRKLNPKVLIMAPTRELAVQIYEVVRQFRIFKTVCLYGGNDRRKQIYFLDNNNPLVVVSTPGRLKDLIDAEFVDLSEIEYLVVDEADRMLDMGFEPQISYLINKCPKERQSMMFSATWPDDVKDLVHKYLKPNHAFLSIGGTKLVANHNIEQKVHVCNYMERFDHLKEIFTNHRNEKMIIFSNTKMSCNKLAHSLNTRFRMRASALHGDMSQRQREDALQGFKSGQLKVICATNVAARGLDIDDVNVVINFDFPMEIETYVHRIGRTGRKNNKGYSYSFFTDSENSSLASSLIEILQESENEIPDELVRISEAKRVSKKTMKTRTTSHYRPKPYRNYSQPTGNYNRFKSGDRHRNYQHDDYY